MKRACTYDVFISHVFEDKPEIADPLNSKLSMRGEERLRRVGKWLGRWFGRIIR
jgi:hypothetical protein